MKYDFLIETYETEILKTLSVWSMFADQDLTFRPNPADARGRSVLEQMVHQCVSEDLWFRTMLAIDVSAPPLPAQETRLDFIQRYSEDAGKRLVALRNKADAWWEESAGFFELQRSRAWIFTRRLNHSAHHRGQLTTMLRALNKSVHSTYGPTYDTGGLMQNHAPTIYAYPDAPTLIQGEQAGGKKKPLPGPGANAGTERPAA